MGSEALISPFSCVTGFGFVTFENEDVVEKVCEIHFHEINNKMVRNLPPKRAEELAPSWNSSGLRWDQFENSLGAVL